ncbi:MAG: hypothetical protein SFY81_04230 [Verrucomicrobiota bacterium]|nr:hypothetical protein [Verrucomicrobiota bacterium]
MEISNLTRKIEVRDVPLDKLAQNSQIPESEKIAEVSRQFEAILLRNILGSAQKPMWGGSAGQSGAVGGIYQDMITTQLADKISASRNIGFAQALESQLSREIRKPSKAAEPSMPLETNNSQEPLRSPRAATESI